MDFAPTTMWFKIVAPSCMSREDNMGLFCCLLLSVCVCPENGRALGLNVHVDEFPPICWNMSSAAFVTS